MYGCLLYPAIADGKLQLKTVKIQIKHGQKFAQVTLDILTSYMKYLSTYLSVLWS